MFNLHCTKKLLDRVKVEISPAPLTSTTVLGNWYATVLLWKPQVALLVNENTLLPVLMPLAPCRDLAERFPEQLTNVLTAHGVPQKFIDHELTQMNEVMYAKTSNRSVVGIMNQFSYLAEGYREYLETKDLLALSIRLSETPCSPLYKGAVSPDRELRRVVSILYPRTAANDERIGGQP
jgi:hypothetical protein